MTDVVARGFHIFMAALCYIVYFIFECYENTKWSEDNLARNEEQTKLFNTRVTALVFAAVNVIFLILATVFFFFQMKDRTIEVEAAGEPPASDDEQ